MRLGGLIFEKWETPTQWAQATIRAGYSAVYFPVDYKSEQSVIDSYVEAAKEHDLLIAEVGVWNNPIDPDPEKRKAARERAIRQLELADYIGAKCCVNCGGTYSTRWDGHHKDNLTPMGMDAIVEATQTILDAVNPTRAKYCIEPMPWMYPNTADSYLELLSKIDRTGFGVHIDIVNVINSPVDYYRTGEVIHEWFTKLGSHVASCHAKDIILGDAYTVHLDECRPGLGGLDYPAYLSHILALGGETPIMLEHMTQEEDYKAAVAYILNLALST